MLGGREEMWMFSGGGFLPGSKPAIKLDLNPRIKITAHTKRNPTKTRSREKTLFISTVQSGRRKVTLFHQNIYNLFLFHIFTFHQNENYFLTLCLYIFIHDLLRNSVAPKIMLLKCV